MIVEAGVQMDSMIARKLWRAVVVNDSSVGQSYMVAQGSKKKVPLPKFSTDVEEAYRIVEFFSVQGYTFRYRHNPQSDLYEAAFYKGGAEYRMVTGKTVPMAICNAALYLKENT